MSKCPADENTKKEPWVVGSMISQMKSFPFEKLGHLLQSKNDFKLTCDVGLVIIADTYR